MLPPSFQIHEQRTRRLVSRNDAIATIDHVQQVRTAIAATTIPCPTATRSARMTARWNAFIAAQASPAVTR